MIMLTPLARIKRQVQVSVVAGPQPASRQDFSEAVHSAGCGVSGIMLMIRSAIYRARCRPQALKGRQTQAAEMRSAPGPAMHKSAACRAGALHRRRQAACTVLHLHAPPPLLASQLACVCCPGHGREVVRQVAKPSSPKLVATRGLQPEADQRLQLAAGGRCTGSAAEFRPAGVLGPMGPFARGMLRAHITFTGVPVGCGRPWAARHASAWRADLMTQGRWIYRRQRTANDMLSGLHSSP